MTKPERYFLEDLQVGQRFESRDHIVDEAQIVAFARSYDPQPFHLDHEQAQDSLFGGLAASGWHTAAITMRLLVGERAPFAGGIVGVGVELSWPTPTRPHDQLRVFSEITEIMPSRSRPGRGRVRLRSETLNQHGEVRQLMTSNLLVPCRSAIAV